MDGNKFLEISKAIVAQRMNELQVSTTIRPSDVFVVWSSKILDNNKGLFSTPLEGSPYFEATYDGFVDKIYLDEYEKKKNTSYGRRWGIWDTKLDKFRTDIGFYSQEDEAYTYFGETLYSMALEGNGGFEGTESEIRAQVDKLTTLELFDAFDYEVREVREGGISYAAE